MAPDAEVGSTDSVWQRFESYEREYITRAVREGKATGAQLDEALSLMLSPQQRWQRMCTRFPRSPPCPRIPKPRLPGWSRLLSGPQEWEWAALRHSTRQQKAKWDDASRSVEDMTIHLSQAEMELRALERNGFVRNHGLQVILCLLLCVGITREIMSNWSLRFQVNIGVLCFTALASLLFAVSWVKSVMKLSEAVFLWLAKTMDHTEKVGEMTKLGIRKHIFSGVFGMLLAPEAETSTIIARCQMQRLSDAHGGSVPWSTSFGMQETQKVSELHFPDQLDMHLAKFRRNMLHPVPKDARTDVPYTMMAETDSHFIDGNGQPMRLKWMLSKHGVDTTVMDAYDEVFFLDDPELAPWTRKPLSWLVDVRSKEVDDIVKSNPFWEKLEFQLHQEQHRVSGFRDYMGTFLFNNPYRFKLFMCVVPVLMFVLVQVLYVNVTGIYHPEVYLDWYTMLIHFAAVLGLLATCVFVAHNMDNARLSQVSVNIILHVLEKQLLKDVMYITNEDGKRRLWCPSLFRDAPNPSEASQDYGGGQERAYEVDYIPALWQAVICEESMKDLGEKLLEVIVESSARHNDLSRKASSSDFSHMQSRVFPW
mmetsp:Transcript_66209/g.158358  ORF Transcript_66209/g.158358 Transcript_66209/m.158358 type:complete len:593 (+) Transcript_66209:100-1878(+)